MSARRNWLWTPEGHTQHSQSIGPLGGRASSFSYTSARTCNGLHTFRLQHRIWDSFTISNSWGSSTSSQLSRRPFIPPLYRALSLGTSLPGTVIAVLKTLQRVVRPVEQISRSALTRLQDIYTRWYRTTAGKILQDHLRISVLFWRILHTPNKGMFWWLQSGKHLHICIARTERRQAGASFPNHQNPELLITDHGTCTGYFSVNVYILIYITFIFICVSSYTFECVVLLWILNL